MASQEAKRSGRDTKGKGVAVPVTILVINRENRQTYVYPPGGVAAYAADPLTEAFGNVSAAHYRFVAIPALPKALAAPESINSLAEPLATRAAVYAQTLLRELRGINFVSSDAWTLTTLKVVGRSALLKGIGDGSDTKAPSSDASEASRSVGSKTTYAWPLPLPLLTTALAHPQAVLSAAKPEPSGELPRQTSPTAAVFVIECRADGTAGVVEQIDLLAFRDGHLARTYWTRDTLDPTYSVKTDKAFTMVAERFQSRMTTLSDETLSGAQGAAEAEPLPSTSLVVGLNRLLPDAAREALVKVTRALADPSVTQPLPVGVDSNYVYYRVSLRDAVAKSGASENALHEALKTQLSQSPHLFAVSAATGRDLRLDPPAAQVKSAP